MASMNALSKGQRAARRTLSSKERARFDADVANATDLSQVRKLNPSNYAANYRATAAAASTGG